MDTITNYRVYFPGLPGTCGEDDTTCMAEDGHIGHQW